MRPQLQADFESPAVELKVSPIHVHGLFPKRKLEAGKLVGEFQCERVSSALADMREARYCRDGFNPSLQ